MAEILFWFLKTGSLNLILLTSSLIHSPNSLHKNADMILSVIPNFPERYHGQQYRFHKRQQQVQNEKTSSIS
jgi:hypothetical protein